MISSLLQPSKTQARPLAASLTSSSLAAAHSLQRPRKMLLYEDILTGDEMFSDAFPMYVAAYCALLPVRDS